MNASPNNLIKRISVDKLFGLYSYDLPDKKEFNKAAILYGDNGAGKSTILKLAFHLISVSDNRGHRTALWNTKFKSITIDLLSGYRIKAERIIVPTQVMTTSSGKLTTNEIKLETLRLTIEKGNSIEAEWDYRPNKDRERIFSSDYIIETVEEDLFGGIHKKVIRSAGKKDSNRLAHPTGDAAFYRKLKEIAPISFILTSDRQLASDSIPDSDEEIEYRRIMRNLEGSNLRELVVKTREIALVQALTTAGRWVASQAIKGTNLGSQNVHNAYETILKQIAGTNSSKVGQKLDVKDATGTLIKRLDAIEQNTKKLAKYEFETVLSTAAYKKALQSKSAKMKQLAIDLVQPYVESLEARLEALNPAYEIADKFINVVNSMLFDKELKYSQTSQSFSIYSRTSETLKPSQLSSGEQQLILLMCYVLTCRDQSSVFMIDEPEISLNIKWQRKLVQSLLDITSGKNIQFIFASHSMELITQHKESVAILKSKK